jgi:hypothetical protein
MEVDVFPFKSATAQCSVEYPDCREASGRLLARIHGMRTGGVLLVDMANLPIVDRDCALFTMGAAMRLMGAQGFDEKHVVVVNATRAVLRRLDEAVDAVDEAYMALGPDGDEIRGKRFLSTLKGVFDVVRENEAGPLDASTVAEKLGIARSAASVRLNDLHRLGFLIKSPGPATDVGRRSVYFTSFDPKDALEEALSKGQLKVWDPAA